MARTIPKIIKLLRYLRKTIFFLNLENLSLWQKLNSFIPLGKTSHIGFTVVGSCRSSAGNLDR